MSVFSKIFGDANERAMRVFLPLVERVNSFESDMRSLSDDTLKHKTGELKKRLAESEEILDDILPEAFALVRESARRVLGQRHFDVQILGGAALHLGKIAEMRTGEGKTLVATLPLYLNALRGKGCHLVTPNDYLSRVGGGWMGAVYHALGISVGVITHDFSGIYDPAHQETPSHGDPRLDHWRRCSRREAYEADITYGTNNEFGFDYLRDNMAYRPEDIVQREHHFAIVDEIDSILIDEARTPLIISMPDQESSEYYKTFAGIVPQLKENADYNIDAKLKAVTITEEGIEKVERLLGVSDIYAEKGFRYVRYLEQALRAQALFHRDRDYVVKDGEVIIVDEFTGRLMPGRRWSEGLHQAVEAKEGVGIQQESRTLATVTFQNYFRMYKKLAGMTGTAATNAEEFHKVYSLDVVTIPTNQPMVREDLQDLIFRTEHGKFLAIAREVKERYKKGQPVLIGTVSIAKNERLSEYLRREGVPHEMLNAKNHEKEALIIAQAGKEGAVTLATNMAGRGVDIILGGTSSGENTNSKTQTHDGEDYQKREHNEIRALGGLHVIGTERHEARRIDNQLRGRAGRQGDPGSSQFFLSLEDELMRVFGGAGIRQMMESFGIPEDQPIENRFVSKAIESAQSKIEGFHFDSRKHLLEYDDVLNKQRDYFYRMRRDILSGAKEPGFLEEHFFGFLASGTDRLLDIHASSGNTTEWNIEEIFESVRSIVDAPDSLHRELERIAAEEGSVAEKRAAIKENVLNFLKVEWGVRKERMGEEGARNTLKVVMLQSIDVLWMEHLDQMEHLRDSVRLRAYGQRDPLVEYKHEGSRLFRDLKNTIQAQIVGAVFKVGMGTGSSASVPVGAGNIVLQSAKDEEQKHGVVSHALKGKKEVGRNDPCPCGSGKKYKKCHGA